MSHDSQQSQKYDLFSSTPPSSRSLVSMGIPECVDPKRPLLSEPRISSQAIGDKVNPSNCVSPTSPILWSPAHPMTAGALFSSPVRGSTSPATSQRGSHGPVTPNSILHATKSAMPSSPLTPLPHEVGPPSSDELRLVSSRHSRSPVDTQTITPTIVHPPTAIAGDTSGRTVRYSLRRRDPRQLNPYAYDKLLYKKLMRLNPDAIVKFLSPKKPRNRREAHEEDTQAEYVPPLSNLDYDFGPTIRGQRKASSAELEGVGQASEEEDVAWLLELLPLSSSDGSDDEIRKLAKRVRRERERAETKARAAEKKAETAARKAQQGEKKFIGKRRKSFPILGLWKEPTSNSKCGTPHVSDFSLTAGWSC